MSEFKIDKNVPMPEERNKYSLYNFGSMEVGDSIKSSDKTQFLLMNVAARQYGRRHNVTFTGRSKDLRIWRIK